MEVSLLAEIIRRSLPDTNLQDARLLGMGQNGAILLAGGVAYKFPKTEAARAAMQIETESLKYIHGKFSFATPEVVSDFLYLSPGEAFFGYVPIAGRRLVKRDYLSQPRLFQQLMDILLEIHALPVELAQGKRDFTYYRAMLSDARAFVFTQLPGRICDAIEALFSRYFDTAEYSLSVIHGDLGISNILFQPDMEKIAGVIDWEQMSLGDPAEDIASLGCPGSLGETFLVDYEKQLKDLALMQRARFYISTFALQETLFGAKNGVAEAFTAGLRGCIKEFGA